MERIQNIWRFISAVLYPFGSAMTGVPSAPWQVVQIIMPIALVAWSGGALWWTKNVEWFSLCALGVYFIVAIFLAWEREYKAKSSLEQRRSPKIKITPSVH